MDNSFVGKSVMVTGATSGIGGAVARAFRSNGARVAAVGRNEVALNELYAADGNEALRIPADVTDHEVMRRVVEDVIRTFGRLDVLVNAAGHISTGTIENTDLVAWDALMNVNLRGTFFCCRTAFKHMKALGEGVIINISSVAGVQAWAGTGVYSASKHGVMALTKALADEGRPFNIKVSAICPGGVADELVDATPEEILRSEKISPFDIAETAVYLSTLGKFAVVQEIVVNRLGADW